MSRKSNRSRLRKILGKTRKDPTLLAREYRARVRKPKWWDLPGLVRFDSTGAGSMAEKVSVPIRFKDIDSSSPWLSVIPFIALGQIMAVVKGGDVLDHILTVLGSVLAYAISSWVAYLIVSFSGFILSISEEDERLWYPIGITILVALGVTGVVISPTWWMTVGMVLAASSPLWVSLWFALVCRRDRVWKQTSDARDGLLALPDETLTVELIRQEIRKAKEKAVGQGNEMSALAERIRTKVGSIESLRRDVYSKAGTTGDSREVRDRMTEVASRRIDGLAAAREMLLRREREIADAFDALERRVCEPLSFSSSVALLARECGEAGGMINEAHEVAMAAVASAEASLGRLHAALEQASASLVDEAAQAQSGDFDADLALVESAADAVSRALVTSDVAATGLRVAEYGGEEAAEFEEIDGKEEKRASALL